MKPADGCHSQNVISKTRPESIIWLCDDHFHSFLNVFILSFFSSLTAHSYIYLTCRRRKRFSNTLNRIEMKQEKKEEKKKIRGKKFFDETKSKNEDGRVCVCVDHRVWNTRCSWRDLHDQTGKVNNGIRITKFYLCHRF